MNREPYSLQDAWQQVGTIYSWIVSLFGTPFEIAEQLLLLRKTRRDILAWLGPAEALARRVLLLKALTLPKPNDTPPRAFAGRLVIAFADRPIPDIDPDAEKWRVRFNVMPKGARRAYRRGGGVNYNALPLARRLEALRRVLENPDAAIARLARLLVARRADIAAAFRPYRPQAACASEALAGVQCELDLALDTS